jgi:hypothetical protein
MDTRKEHAMNHKWSDFERYLKSAHLLGRRATVKIQRVAIEELHPRPGKVERAPVIYFEGKSKGLILSATNQRTLARLFGDEMGACVGKLVSLEAVEVKVAGVSKFPIRIKGAQIQEAAAGKTAAA